jgi:hypothetical protein
VLPPFGLQQSLRLGLPRQPLQEIGESTVGKAIVDKLFAVVDKLSMSVFHIYDGFWSLQSRSRRFA